MHIDVTRSVIVGKVIGYVRVSTDRQAEVGLGVEIQEEAIRAWAKLARHRLVDVVRDEGVSGGNGLESREGLVVALEALGEGRAAGLVVYRLDRLARDLVVQEQLLAEVRRLGSEVFSTFESEQAYLSDDPDDPSRKLIRQILGAVSEYERAMTVLRLKLGRRRKAEKGGFAFGSPPFGYRGVHGDLKPDVDEQATLRRMHSLSGEGASLRQIAETLNGEGHKAKRGGPWHPQTVARALATPMADIGHAPASVLGPAADVAEVRSERASLDDLPTRRFGED
jgi:DNA invertase Pin-like site-specific DNA recombinase